MEDKKIKKFINALQGEYVETDEMVMAIKLTSEHLMSLLANIKEKVENEISEVKIDSKNEFIAIRDSIEDKEQDLNNIISNLKEATEEDIMDLSNKIIDETISIREIIATLPRMSDVESLTSKVSEQIPSMETIENYISSNLPRHGDMIRNGLELLKGDDRLDQSAIKGLEEKSIDWEKRTLDRAMGILDQRTSYLINKVSDIRTTTSMGDRITSAAEGSVLFAGPSGTLAQDNPNLYWDDTNNRLGIGTATPSQRLDVQGGTLKVGTGDANADSYTNRINSIIFNRADLTTSYFNKITNSFSGVLANTGMNFELTDADGTGYTTVMALRGSGNVGIGTTAPSKKLDVYGDAIFGTTGAITLSDAGSGNGRAIFTNIGAMDASTHLFRNTAGTSEWVRITNTGSVGIGTTDPAVRFHVSKADSASVLFSGTTMATRFSQNTGGSLIEGVDNTGFGSYQPLALKASTLTFDTASTAMTILNGGNVGIGTTGPLNKLSVANPGVDSVGIELRSAASDLGVGAHYSSARILSTFENTSYYGTRLDLQTATGENTWLTGLSVKNGNVGIGTTNPGAKFQVDASDTLSRGFLVYGNTSPNGTAIRSDSGGWAQGYNFEGPNGTSMGGFGAAGTNNTFAYYYIGTYANQGLTVLDNGNVGIGNTSPLAGLHVTRNYVDALNVNVRLSGNLPGISFDKLSGPVDSRNFAILSEYNDSGLLQFNYSSASGGNPTNNAMTIDGANGHVGIGTFAPNSPLSVVRSDEGVIAGFGANGTQDLLTINYNGGTLDLTSSLYGPLVFKSQNNHNIALTPHGTGKVGIGTAAPSYMLDVLASGISGANNIGANFTTNISDTNGTTAYGLKQTGTVASSVAGNGNAIGIEAGLNANTGTKPVGIIGFSASLSNTAAGTLTQLINFQTGGASTAGTVTNSYGFYARDVYAVGGTVTNQTALRIQPLTSATNNYGVYFENAPNGGSITSAAATDISMVPGTTGKILTGSSAVDLGGKFNIFNGTTVPVLIIQSNGVAASGTIAGIYHGGTEVTGSIYSLNAQANSSASGIVGIQQNASGAAEFRAHASGAGDAFVHLYAGTAWSLGVDNSDSDKFKIVSDAALGNTPDFVITTTGEVGIGVNAPDANAILDVTSTTKAFMPPRMTTAQKNAISSPTAGMVVYDTTLGKLAVYTTAWEAVTSA